MVDGEMWILFFCPEDSIRAAVLTVSPLAIGAAEKRQRDEGNLFCNGDNCQILLFTHNN